MPGGFKCRMYPLGGRAAGGLSAPLGLRPHPPEDICEQMIYVLGRGLGWMICKDLHAMAYNKCKTMLDGVIFGAPSVDPAGGAG